MSDFGLSKDGNHEEDMARMSPFSIEDDIVEKDMLHDVGFTVMVGPPFAEYHAAVANMGSMVLSFALILCLWDTWSTLTDIVTPMPDHFIARCILNGCLCVLSSIILKKFTDAGNSKKMIIFGNLLGGVGVWEFTETIIQAAFGDSNFAKLSFYICCLLITYAVVVYLERTNRLNVMDSQFMSAL